jgi:hypothetical protein
MTRPTLRFDEAWSRARELILAELGSYGSRAVLQRDVRGRISVAIDNRQDPESFSKHQQAGLEARFRKELGAYAARGQVVFAWTDLLVPNEVFDNPNASSLEPSRPHGPRVLERSIIGADWLRPSLETGPEKLKGPQRLTFFGIKGGVGRSTALAVVAQRVASRGKTVLVLDLDLESPGIGSTLLPPKLTPEFGIADWFVEQGVGQADDELESKMIGDSPLSAGRGSIYVLPAAGRERDHYDYLSKLARVYSLAPGPEGKPVDFASRLHELVERFERRLVPDVVLLDSRAGLHDIAAVTVTRLGATSLLFAVNSTQTWDAYRWLFRAWRANPQLAISLVDNLKVVAALTPETGAGEYLDDLRAQSYKAFLAHLYQELAPGEIADGSWDLMDREAPHSPLRVQWSRAFQTYDPLGRPGDVTPEQIALAFSELFAWLGQRLFEGEL